MNMDKLTFYALLAVLVVVGYVATIMTNCAILKDIGIWVIVSFLGALFVVGVLGTVCIFRDKKMDQNAEDTKRTISTNERHSECHCYKSETVVSPNTNKI